LAEYLLVHEKEDDDNHDEVKVEPLEEHVVHHAQRRLNEAEDK
jgi:hypothetical protein